MRSVGGPGQTRTDTSMWTTGSEPAASTNFTTGPKDWCSQLASEQQPLCDQNGALPPELCEQNWDEPAWSWLTTRDDFHFHHTHHRYTVIFHSRRKMSQSLIRKPRSGEMMSWIWKHEHVHAAHDGSPACGAESAGWVRLSGVPATCPDCRQALNWEPLILEPGDLYYSPFLRYGVSTSSRPPAGNKPGTFQS